MEIQNKIEIIKIFQIRKKVFKLKKEPKQELISSFVNNYKLNQNWNKVFKITVLKFLIFLKGYLSKKQ